MDEPDKPPFVRCSFCGISQKQARRIITGPGVYICERCVGLCNGILETELPDVDEQVPPAGVAVLPAPGEAGRTLACPFPEDLDRMLQTLDAREREVLWLRFGLDRGEPRTLIEVADRFNLPPERIKEIETGAISKIRPMDP